MRCKIRKQLRFDFNDNGINSGSRNTTSPTEDARELRAVPKAALDKANVFAITVTTMIIICPHWHHRIKMGAANTNRIRINDAPLRGIIYGAKL